MHRRHAQGTPRPAALPGSCNDPKEGKATVLSLPRDSWFRLVIGFLSLPPAAYYCEVGDGGRRRPPVGAPAKRLIEREVQAARRWKHGRRPGLQNAAIEGRTLVFVDEPGLSKRPTRMRAWALPGGKRRYCSSASTASSGAHAPASPIGNAAFGSFRARSRDGRSSNSRRRFRARSTAHSLSSRADNTTCSGPFGAGWRCG